MTWKFESIDLGFSTSNAESISDWATSKLKLLGKEGKQQIVSESCRDVRPETVASWLGRRFGRLRVVKLNKKRTQSDKIYWYCRCDCGKTATASDSALLAGTTSSCGCLAAETRIRNARATFKGYEEITGNFWRSLCRGAEKRGIVVSVTIEDVWKQYLKQDRKCALTGIPVTFLRLKRIDQTASVDRICSDRDYELENIQILHKRVNVIKGTMTNAETLLWANLLVAQEAQDLETCNRLYAEIARTPTLRLTRHRDPAE